MVVANPVLTASVWLCWTEVSRLQWS